MYIEKIKEDAKQMLQEYWVQAVIVTIVVWLLTDAFTQQRAAEISKHGMEVKGMNLANLISLILSGPLALGVAKFYMNVEAGYTVSATILGEGFSDFRRTFIFHLISTLFIILWAILLVVPGIIAAIRYSMGYYIMAENHEIEPMEALRQSSALMEGNKMDFFRLVMSFLGWFLLSIVTMGIGFLYLVPYFQMSKLNFYRSIQYEREQIQKG
jgi:uncharacterized membrane protein